ncbi:hypothetical protein GW17_00018706 [Ensete ventricosum]|nr:hypothetical protein GW17_00018706 [Ensete ventricosum]
MIAQVAGCDESVEVFRKVNDSGGNKAVGDVREVDRAEAVVRARAGEESSVSARGKSKAEVLLRVLESGRGSQL